MIREIPFKKSSHGQYPDHVTVIINPIPPEPSPTSRCQIRMKSFLSQFLDETPLGKVKCLPVIIVLILLTGTLGMHGFALAFPDIHVATRLFMTIHLFLLDSQSIELVDANDQEVPPTLAWARWMAAAITVSGIGIAIWKILQKTTGIRKLRKCKGHLIVFGSGKVVETVLREADKKNSQCVLVSSCQQLVERRREQKKLAVEIAALDNGLSTLETEHLELAGLSKAKAFYALHSSDAENLRAALLVRNMQTGAETEIIVRQDEPSTCDLLQRNALLSPGRDGKGLRVISVDNTRARMLLKQYPLEWHEDHGLASQVYLVIPKLDRFAKAVAIQAALIGHYKNGGQVNLRLVSENDLSQLEQYYPKIRKCLHVDFLGEQGLRSAPGIVRENTGALVTVIMTHLSAEEGYIEALRLHEEFPPGNHFRVILQSPLPGDSMGGKRSPDLCVAPALEGLLGNLEGLDRVARKIHETWRQGNENKINKARDEGKEEEAKKLESKPTYKSWADLSEEHKDNNRAAADQIEVKIRAVELDPSQSDLQEKWAKLSNEQLDILSRMEHERWMAPHWLRNWESGERNDEARVHNNLVAYDELDKDTQDYDTDQVRAAAGYLKESP